MEKVGIFLAIWNFLLPFGKFYGHLARLGSFGILYSPFWYIIPRKIWQPWCVHRPFQESGQLKQKVKSTTETASS
jgi:hypothetical protein